VRRGDRAIEPSPLPGKVGSFPIEPEDVVRGLPWGGVRTLSGRPLPIRSSHVASTTSGPMPWPGSATMVFMAIMGSPYL